MNRNYEQLKFDIMTKKNENSTNKIMLQMEKSAMLLKEIIVVNLVLLEVLPVKVKMAQLLLLNQME